MLIIKPKINYDCDALIVGGGPAGSGLAYHLAKAGLHVIVVEAEKFPRDKICGDGVSPIAISELHAMGITDTHVFKTANEITQVGLFIKDDKVSINLTKPDNLPFHARIIPRMVLDHQIYEAAKQAGASYLEEARVSGYVITPYAAITTIKQGHQVFQLKSRIIIGADGSNSVIARQLRGSKPKEDFQLLGLRAYYDGVSGPKNRVDIYFSSNNFPGIFWLFPKGETGANVGMAMVSKTLPHKPEHVKKLLHQHMLTNPDIRARIGDGSISGKIEGWPITFFDAKSPITAERLILVGEAAGLINPLSGDGIQYALLSARWAAEVLGSCFANDDFSHEAVAKFRVKIEQELAFDFALSNLLVQFPRNKIFTPIWMAILSILISRAKSDKEFAETIAGIFEGTYPSYKALNLSFILKSLSQGGQDLSDYLSRSMGDLNQLRDTGLTMTRSAIQMISAVGSDPTVQAKWLLETLGKLISVSKYAWKANK